MPDLAPELPDLLGTSPADLLASPEPVGYTNIFTARQRAERIRADLITYSRMRQDIADAYAMRDWAALGYASWYEYLQGEFGQELQQLARSREDRQLAVGDLRGQGLSTRQIAAVAGVDPKTVRNDLAELPAAAPAERVTGSDGKSYPAQQRQARAESEWEQVHQALGECANAYGLGGWATAKTVADRLGAGWSPSLVTRRLNALREGGRVDFSNDRTVTGIRGTAWRPRADAPQRAAGMIVVELPADDVEPPAAATAAKPAAASDDNRVSCEQCKTMLNVLDAEDGYLRCTTCDPNGHYVTSKSQPDGPADGPESARWRCFGCETEFEAAENTCPKCGGWGIRQNDPAGPVAAAADPPAAATSRDSRPEDRPGPQLPADRDPQEATAEPGEGSPAAVATTGQPGGAPASVPVVTGDGGGPLRIAGSDAVEVYDHGLIHIGDRDLHLLAGRIDGDVPVAWLAVEELANERELLALNALQVQLLIQKLTAIHGWLTGEQLPDDE